MRLITWNINSIRARLASLLVLIEQEQPDIILLQETKAEDHVIPREPLESLGYRVKTLGQKSYNGVAILYRQDRGEPRWEHTFPHNPFPHEARYLMGFWDHYAIASLYIPNGKAVGSEAFQKKGVFLTHLIEHVSGIETPCLLGGDWNVALTDADSGLPRSPQRLLCSPQERKWLSSFLTHGWRDPENDKDPVGHKHPFTWWDYRLGSAWHQGMRIDGFWLNPEAQSAYHASGVLTAFRHVSKPSDHAPVWIDMNWSSEIPRN